MDKPLDTMEGLMKAIINFIMWGGCHPPFSPEVFIYSSGKKKRLFLG